jgi:hypothetical protein
VTFVRGAEPVSVVAEVAAFANLDVDVTDRRP